jgi:hypothetical protein
MTRLPATKATAGPNHLNSQRHPVSDASLVEAAIERPTISPTSQRQAFPQGAWSHAQGVGWWLASGVHPEHGEAGRGQRLIAHTRQEHRCRSLGCPATKGCSPGEGLPLSFRSIDGPGSFDGMPPAETEARHYALRRPPLNPAVRFRSSSASCGCASP